MITIALITVAIICAASIEKSLRAERQKKMEKKMRRATVKEVMRRFELRHEVLDVLRDPLRGIERRRQYEKAAEKRICRGQ